MISSYEIDFIDEVAEFAKNLSNSEKYDGLPISIYSDSGFDDCGRQHGIDIRAYWQRDD